MYNLLAFFGRNSLYIMCTHNVFYGILLSLGVNNMSINHYVVGLFSFVIVVLICSITIFVINNSFLRKFKMLLGVN